MSRSRRIDYEILMRSARICVPRHDKGFDVGAEAVGDMSRHFHDLVRFGAVPFADRHKQSVGGMGNEFVQPNGVTRPR